MKIRLLLSLVGLAIGFAVPAIAEEQNTADPEVRRQIEALIVNLDEAYNKSDAPAVAALSAQDAVEVWYGQPEGGLASGQQAIEKRYAGELGPGAHHLSHKLLQAYAIGSDICAIMEWSLPPIDTIGQSNPSDHITKLSYVYAFGDDLCGIGGRSVTVNPGRVIPQVGGYLIRVYTRVTDTWKIRVQVDKYRAGP